MEARVLVCGACGGTLPERVGTCPFCSAVVVARHCLSCFQPNLESAVHCAACGRELGLEPIADGADPLRCPSCDVPFVKVPAGSGDVHECPRCLGQFLAHDTLRALCEERIELRLRGELQPQLAGPTSQQRQPVRYVPCPICHARMNRKNFGERSGVVVDVCKADGVYLDRGELPRVLAFVEAGGLRDAERREDERRKEASRKSAMAAFTVAHDPQESTDHGVFVIDLLRHLLM